MDRVGRDWTTKLYESKYWRRLRKEVPEQLNEERW